MKNKLFLLSFVLCLVLLCGCMANPDATGQTTAGISTEAPAPSVDISSELNGIYYPFVYDFRNDWLVEYLGPNECSPGLLYVVNTATKEI